MKLGERLLNKETVVAGRLLSLYVIFQASRTQNLFSVVDARNAFWDRPGRMTLNSLNGFNMAVDEGTVSFYELPLAEI